MDSGLDISYQLNHPPCIQEVLQEDAVVIDLDTGTYHNLREFSATIWSLIIDAQPLSHIISSIDASDANKSLFTICLQDFVQTLLAKKLIRLCDTANDKAIDVMVLPDNYSLVCESYTDMQEMLLLDPIHDVDDTLGWPMKKNAV